MRRRLPTGRTEFPIGSNHGPNQRLLRVPHPSPPITGRHVCGIPIRKLRTHPLGKSLNLSKNPNEIGSKSHLRIDLSSPPILKQPQFSLSSPKIHPNRRRFNLRRRRRDRHVVPRIRVQNLGEKPGPTCRLLRPVPRSRPLEARMDLHRPSRQVLDRAHEADDSEDRVFVRVYLRRRSGDGRHEKSCRSGA